MINPIPSYSPFKRDVKGDGQGTVIQTVEKGMGQNPFPLPPVCPLSLSVPLKEGTKKEEGYGGERKSKCSCHFN